MDDLREGSSEFSVADGETFDDPGYQEFSEPTDQGVSDEGDNEHVDEKDGHDPVDKGEDDEQSGEEDGQQTEGEEETSDKDGEEDSESEEEGQEDEENSDGEESDARQITIKDGEKFSKLSEDATIRVNIGGENELVSMRELTEGYRSAAEQDQLYDEFYQQKEEQDQKVQALSAEMQMVGGLMKGDRPLDAALYLAKVAGIDVVDLRQRIVDNLANEVTPMVDMSEAERKLALIEAGRADSARIDALLAKQQESAPVGNSNLNSLLRVSGVSRRAYEESRGVLGEDASPEEVIEYAQHAPYLSQAEELLAPLEDQLGQKEMQEYLGHLTMALRKTGGRGDFKMVQRIGSQLGYDVQGESESKSGKKPPPAKKKATRKVKFDPDGETF